MTVVSNRRSEVDREAAGLRLQELVLGHDGSSGLREEFGWIELRGARLLAVRHCASQVQRSRILAIGPIGAERERAHRTIVETARALAQHGHEVLRYDHRGIGESEGRFDRCTIGTWTLDAADVARAMDSRTNGMPLVLLGVRVGALVASAVFAQGIGDALVLIAGGDGQVLLRDAARRALAADLVQSSAHGAVARTRSRSAWSELLAGREAIVDGYPWTPALVSDASSRRLVLPDEADMRPWTILECDGAGPAKPRAGESVARDAHRRPVRALRFWESSPSLAPDDASLAVAIDDWLRDALSQRSVVSASPRSGLSADEGNGIGIRNL